ncbi:DNA fragmentation factor subunit alpha [Hypomesus transpacificus]|uniref:DNA fragmentation factor subunit alpha n=1 Tax=Hypomesus transpacificus TaxID=137520 RepID=UPI001F07B122|nr:DNA fragmentation factor subunit alpha [Hypomesus transpacificus]
MTELKPCKVCNVSRQKSYGLVVSSLTQLKIKGCESLGFDPDAVSVVLEDDGTIVEDEAYFLCLPPNTKFMLLHQREIWAPLKKIDGGTAWLTRDSMDLETVEADSVDSSLAVPHSWQSLAQQLRQDLASIILMSEADLQSLVDVPGLELASALGFQENKAQNLQETLQRVLDRREEERQSKELLQLYLRAVEKEDSQPALPSQTGAGDMDVPDGMEVDSSSGFMSRTLMVMKGKTSPETRLSNEEIQMVVSKGAASMEQVLGWGPERTSALLQACEGELTRRLQKVQAMHSLTASSISPSQQDGTLPSADSPDQHTPVKRSK